MADSASGSTPGIADVAFVRAMVALRWLILAAYVVMVKTAVIDAGTTALVLSAGALAVYFAAFTWHAFTGWPGPGFMSVVPFADAAAVSVLLIAMHDVSASMWAAYFLTIVVAGHFLSGRGMLANIYWSNATYLAAAAITAARGYDVDWRDVAVVSVLLQFMGHHVTALAGGERRLREYIARSATTDLLTGLPNRRRFEEEAAAAIASAEKRSASVSVLLVDMDHLKDVNDGRGHLAGDDVLRELARVLRAAARPGDIVGRFGGDEFIVLAGARADEGHALGERIRSAASSRDISISIGVATLPDDAGSLYDLIESADAALYWAKKSGRNRVIRAA